MDQAKEKEMSLNYRIYYRMQIGSKGEAGVNMAVFLKNNEKHTKLRFLKIFSIVRSSK